MQTPRPLWKQKVVSRPISGSGLAERTYGVNHGGLLGEVPMNWTRGLLRVWAVLALCWVGSTTLVMQDLIFPPSCSAHEACDFRPPSLGPEPSLQEKRIEAAKLISVPPLGLLVLGFLVVWAVRGFRR